MNCEEALKLMDGYLDAELDPAISQDIEQHLGHCQNCERAYATQRALERALQSAPYYKASSALRQRIQSSLQDEIGHSRLEPSRREGKRPTGLAPSAQRSVIFETPWNWVGMAAAVLLTALIAWNLASRAERRNANQFLATQLIASHVRSLMANHLTDIASSDQHTVKPWLDAKLDFAAPVVDLASEGFPLVGGRLDYLDNRPVAALVYGRRKHFINLFIWLAEPGMPGAAESITRQGYQLLHWTDLDFSYWAVSDVNANDLQTFKNLFEKQLPHK
jgi:anti-sigma factor RsiW